MKRIRFAYDILSVQGGKQVIHEDSLTILVKDSVGRQRGS